MFITDLIRRKGLKERIIVILFLLPTIAGLLIFQYIPFGLALKNSLYDLNLLKPDAASFIKFGNYAKMLTDSNLHQAFNNTFLYTGLKVIIQVPLALFAAVFLQQKIKGIGIVRSAIFAPIVTSVTVVAVIFNLIYHPELGLMNSLFQFFGLDRQPFLNSTKQALVSILGMSIWQDVGFTMLLLLSGLQGIPNLYYEVSQLDGANPVQQFFLITLPLLKRTILYAVVVTTIFSFTVFTPVYVMTKGGPEGSTRLAVYYVWEQGFKFLNMGYASAIAVILMIIMVIIALIQGRLLRSELEY